VNPDDVGAKFLRNVVLQEPQGVTSHKAAFFIVTAVKTSGFTKSNPLTLIETEISLFRKCG
jgi:hypothetical protein